MRAVQGSEFDETDFFRSIAACGARALLIGRRALIARSAPTVDGVRIAFDEIWPRRQALEIAAGVTVAVPALDDLILTKRLGGRPKDLEDIRLLEALRKEGP
jgi:hypothetical protein